MNDKAQPRPALDHHRESPHHHCGRRRFGAVCAAPTGQSLSAQSQLSWLLSVTLAARSRLPGRSTTPSTIHGRHWHSATGPTS